MAMAMEDYKQSPINWFSDYPEYAVARVEEIIVRVMAERALYPFPVTSIQRKPEGGYRAW